VLILYLKLSGTNGFDCNVTNVFIPYQYKSAVYLLSFGERTAIKMVQIEFVQSKNNCTEKKQLFCGSVVS